MHPIDKLLGEVGGNRNNFGKTFGINTGRLQYLVKNVDSVSSMKIELIEQLSAYTGLSFEEVILRLREHENVPEYVTNPEKFRVKEPEQRKAEIKSRYEERTLTE